MWWELSGMLIGGHPVSLVVGTYEITLKNAPDYFRRRPQSADSRADSVEFSDTVCYDSRIRQRRIGCWKCPRHQVMAA